MSTKMCQLYPPWLEGCTSSEARSVILTIGLKVKLNNHAELKPALSENLRFFSPIYELDSILDNPKVFSTISQNECHILTETKQGESHIIIIIFISYTALSNH